MALSRRMFLAGLGLGAGAALGGAFRASGGANRAPILLRPPGALDEPDFLAACIRCGQCVEVCPNETLKLAGPSDGLDSGTPYLVPESVPCNLCAGHSELKCIAACPTQALMPVANYRDIRMGTAVVFANICLAFNGVSCRSCWHACPYPDEAVQFDELLRPVINEDACIGCGLCTHACPTDPKSIPIRPRGGKKLTPPPTPEIIVEEDV